MRILSLGNMYPPHHLGGYELVWASATEHLRAHGHDVRVLTTDFRLASTGADQPGVFRELRWYWKEHEWPRLGAWQRLALERHNHRVLQCHLAEHRPNAVAWWAMGGMSLSLVERIRRLGLSSVAFVHDDWLLYGPQVDQWTRVFAGRPRAGRLAELLTGVPARIDLERSARYMLVSETVRDHARAGGLRLEQSSIAHSGVAAGFFRDQPAPPWRWRLLYVGRIDERKGVSDLLTALGELPASSTVTLVGDGDRRELAHLRDLSAQLGVAHRVKELGMRSTSELVEIYADADVLVFPVRWEEPWGLVPLEAMAAGCPVIATGQGGSGEYLAHEDNALLVEPGNPSALATAVKRMASDHKLRDRLRLHGRRTAASHRQDDFNQAVLAAVEELAGSVPAPAPAT